MELEQKINVQNRRQLYISVVWSIVCVCVCVPCTHMNKHAILSFLPFYSRDNGIRICPNQKKKKKYYIEFWVAFFFVLLTSWNYTKFFFLLLFLFIAYWLYMIHSINKWNEWMDCNERKITMKNTKHKHAQRPNDKSINR